MDPEAFSTLLRECVSILDEESEELETVLYQRYNGREELFRCKIPRDELAMMKHSRKSDAIRKFKPMKSIEEEDPRYLPTIALLSKGESLRPGGVLCKVEGFLDGHPMILGVDTGGAHSCISLPRLRRMCGDQECNILPGTSQLYGIDGHTIEVVGTTTMRVKFHNDDREYLWPFSVLKKDYKGIVLLGIDFLHA